jgi:inorganic pyrophosphatase/exopolyphosphatase
LPAVEGIEEAEVAEVIDHRRLAHNRSDAPISCPEIMEGFFEMKGVISRKKQVIPYLLDMLRNL